MSTSPWLPPSPAKTELPPRRAKVARLLAEGELGVTQIAEAVGVSRRTVWEWGKDPAVKQFIREHSAALDEETYRTGLARKRNRVAQRSEMAAKLFKMIMASSKPNVGLIREYNNLLESIAKELGQWAEKVDVTGEIEVNGPPVIREVTITLTELPRNETQEEIIDVEPVEVDAGLVYRIEPGSPEAIAQARENQRFEIERIKNDQLARMSGQR